MIILLFNPHAGFSSDISDNVDGFGLLELPVSSFTKAKEAAAAQPVISNTQTEYLRVNGVSVITEERRDLRTSYSSSNNGVRRVL